MLFPTIRPLECLDPAFIVLLEKVRGVRCCYGNIILGIIENQFCNTRLWGIKEIHEIVSINHTD